MEEFIDTVSPAQNTVSFKVKSAIAWRTFISFVRVNVQLEELSVAVSLAEKSPLAGKIYFRESKSTKIAVSIFHTRDDTGLMPDFKL
jgi:hypothetical protein